MLLSHMIRPVNFIWGTLKEFCGEEVFYSYDLHVLQSLIEIEIFKEAQYTIKGTMLGILANAIALAQDRKRLEGKTRANERRSKLEIKKSRLLKYSEYEK